MIGFLLELVVLCLVLGLIYWIAQLIISNFAPPPIAGKALVLAQIIVALIFVLWLLSFIGWVDVPFPRTRRPW